MPYYEYICDSCGHTTVERKAIDRRDDLPTCQHGEAGNPASHPMRRVVSRKTSFVLTGTGWAKDNYKGT